VYALNRVNRPAGGESVLRDSLPSLLFPLACFALVALLPKRIGGQDGQPVGTRNVLIGTLLACVIFEGVAPWLRMGSADWNDVFALILGSMLYAGFSVLAKR